MTPVETSSWLSRRRFLEAAGGIGGGAWLAAVAQGQEPGEGAGATPWDLVKIGPVEYVTQASVKSFYGFSRVIREDKDILFREGRTSMKWTIGSPFIFINSIKFSLSFPVEEMNQEAHVSRVDLQKLLDPVLRPWYIKEAEGFDTVIIDPGHGGHDPGARHARVLEKTMALDTAMRLKVEVEALGFKTHLTRTRDVFVSLAERVRIANRTKDAVFVSLHYNWGENRAVSGIETYALAPQGTISTNDGSVRAAAFSGNRLDAENIALATAVHAMVMTSLTAEDRGVKRARYNVLRGIQHPAILFEGGFLSNDTETSKILTEDYRARVAKAVAAGIYNFSRAIGCAPK